MMLYNLSGGGNNGGGGGKGNGTMYILVCICCMIVSYMAGAVIIYLWHNRKDTFVASNEDLQPGW